jgi:hypothetical protein
MELLNLTPKKSRKKLKLIKQNLKYLTPLHPKSLTRPPKTWM